MEKVLILLLLSSILNAEFVVRSYIDIKNENVIRQTYEESCGASSLATLINMIDDKRLSELDVLKIISGDELNTDSVSFASLSDAISKMGYESRSYQIGRNALNKLINLPIIVKIENDPRYPHFVVIINYNGDYIKILDPSHGEYIKF